MVWITLHILCLQPYTALKRVALQGVPGARNSVVNSSCSSFGSQLNMAGIDSPALLSSKDTGDPEFFPACSRRYRHPSNQTNSLGQSHRLVAIYPPIPIERITMPAPAWLNALVGHKSQSPLMIPRQLIVEASFLARGTLRLFDSQIAALKSSENLPFYPTLRIFIPKSIHPSNR